ncbi:MAG: hypothetical protein WBN04_12275 [Paracoccaceae bacterium]
MTYQERADHLAAMIEERLGIRGKGLEAKLRRAGRLLPAHIHRSADLLVEAMQLQASPKFARRIDEQKVVSACKSVEKYLMTIDPSTRRMDRVIGFLSSNAFNLLATGGLVIAVLIWRGYV